MSYSRKHRLKIIFRSEATWESSESLPKNQIKAFEDEYQGGDNVIISGRKIINNILHYEVKPVGQNKKSWKPIFGKRSSYLSTKTIFLKKLMILTQSENGKSPNTSPVQITNSMRLKNTKLR